MSADKHKSETRATKLMALIHEGHEHRKMVNAEGGIPLDKTLRRLIDLGLVKLSRPRVWSSFGPHIRRTFASLTPTGEGFVNLLQEYDERKRTKRPKKRSSKRPQPEGLCGHGCRAPGCDE